MVGLRALPVKGAYLALARESLFIKQSDGSFEASARLGGRGDRHLAKCPGVCEGVFGEDRCLNR